MADATEPSPPITKHPWGWREIATFVVAMTVIVGFFILVFVLAFEGKLASGQQDFIMGVITGAFTASVTFYVGSSQGSVAKTDILEKKG